MKNLLKTSALVAALSFGAYNANATNKFTVSDDFTLNIAFVSAITISVDDATLSNAVGGDTINIDLPITKNKAGARPATCAITTDNNITNTTNTLTLNHGGTPGAGEAANFDLTIDVDDSANCTVVELDGTLPLNASNSATYSGTATITYAYNVKTHVFGDLD